VRARDLAITYPSLSTDAPGEEAAPLLAEEAGEGVFFQSEQGDSQGCVSDTTLLGFLLPGYLAKDRALVGILGEDVASACGSGWVAERSGTCCRPRRRAWPRSTTTRC
jgi:hypothetical protein